VWGWCDVSLVFEQCHINLLSNNIMGDTICRQTVYVFKHKIEVITFVVACQ
jgi:hypothetical protein